MSKKLVVVLLAAMLTLGVSIAQATPSRLETLGQGTGLVYVQDDTDIFYNPATLGYYRNVGLLHMGGYSGDMYALGGLSLGLGDMLTVGLIFARNPSYELGALSVMWWANAALDPAGSLTSPKWLWNDNWAAYPGTYTVDIATSIGGYDAAMEWMNPIDIILAAKLGNMQLGVSWYTASGKHESTYEDDSPADYSETLKSRINALKVGLSADMGNVMPEVWFHWVPFKVSSTWEDDIANTEINRELKGRRFNLGARAFYKMSDAVTIVPAIEWSNVNGDVSIDTTPDFYPTSVSTIIEEDLSENYKGNRINAGIGLNYAVDKVLVATSIGLQWYSFTRTLEVDGLDGSEEEVRKWLALPVVGLGVEYQATKIVTFRGGISTTTIYARYRNEDSADTAGSLNYEDTSSTTAQNTTASVGVGLNFGNLVIDLTAGNLLVAGEPATFSLFSALDAKYKF